MAVSDPVRAAPQRCNCLDEGGVFCESSRERGGLSRVDEHWRSADSGGLILDARRDENLLSDLAVRSVVNMAEWAQKSLFDGTETILMR